jgi:hypothetical protein
VWGYEGSNTLASYLSRRDGLKALARDLGVAEELVIPVAMRQVGPGLCAGAGQGRVMGRGARWPQQPTQLPGVAWEL